MTTILSDMETRLYQATIALERERGVVEAIAVKGERALILSVEAHDVAVACEEASRLLAQFADERQAEIIETIQSIASLGLSQIFDEDIELVIRQVVRARRVEMDVMIKTGDLETSILDARGGGLAAVAGFLLRVAILLLTPNVRRLLLLDESFAMLSEDYVSRMAEFLTELCETTGLQIILVTHQQEFAESANSVIRIEKTGVNSSRLVKER